MKIINPPYEPVTGHVVCAHRLDPKEGTLIVVGIVLCIDDEDIHMIDLSFNRYAMDSRRWQFSFIEDRTAIYCEMFKIPSQ